VAIIPQEGKTCSSGVPLPSNRKGAVGCSLCLDCVICGAHLVAETIAVQVPPESCLGVQFLVQGIIDGDVKLHMVSRNKVSHLLKRCALIRCRAR
jgi:hypothetical protein